MSDFFDTPDIDGGDNATAIAKDELRKLVQQREALEKQKAEIADDIKDLNVIVKAKGFNLRAFNEIIKLRKLDEDERNDREAMRQLYADILGIFG